MGITLDDVLVLAGRLDDAAGFDTPRERFRRFLIEQEASGQIGRTLVDHCPHLVDEQHHRALQDLVVLLGRSLGFETTFGTYLPVSSSLKSVGYWRSRTRLDIVLELRTNHTPITDFETLARSIAAHAATTGRGSQAHVIGLAVLTPGYPGRSRLEQFLAAATLDVTIRVVSLRSLLFLADTVRAGRLTHDDVVRFFDTVATADFVIGLFEKLAHADADDVAHRTAPRGAETGPAFWLATVDGDSVITPERFLEVVIGKRRIFGVRGAGHPDGIVRAGDRICFYVSDRGAVGRADVASIEPKGTGLRDVHQYTQLLRLDHVELYPDAPLVPESETMLRLRAAQGDASPRWHALMRISEQIFESLTRREAQETAVGTPPTGGRLGPRRAAAPKTLSDGGSRSRE
jgi:hypothetical protein